MGARFRARVRVRVRGFGLGFGIGFGFGSRIRPSAVKPEEKRLAYIIITIEETPYCLKTFDCQLDVNESAPM